ncbi:hypothetical protein HAX54_025481, partial [Datura stramonium]|nr:hypothetical protein [Datura stramonium]
ANWFPFWIKVTPQVMAHHLLDGTLSWASTLISDLKTSVHFYEKPPQDPSTALAYLRDQQHGAQALLRDERHEALALKREEKREAPEFICDKVYDATLVWRGAPAFS